MNTDFFGNSRYKGGHGEYVQCSGGYILLPLHPLQQNGALPLFSCVSAVGLTAGIYSIWSQGPLTWRGGGLSLVSSSSSRINFNHNDPAWTPYGCPVSQSYIFAVVIKNLQTMYFLSVPFRFWLLIYKRSFFQEQKEGFQARIHISSLTVWCWDFSKTVTSAGGWRGQREATSHDLFHRGAFNKSRRSGNCRQPRSRTIQTPFSVSGGRHKKPGPLLLWALKQRL